MSRALGLLLVVVACSQVFVEGKWKCSDCGIKYNAVGCYKDDGERPLPYEILNERDRTSKVFGGRMINWHDWDNYIEGFACRCAALAKKKGYRVFGLQFYGECWSGPGLDTYSKVGLAKESDCVGPQYKPCNKFTRHCVGSQFKNFVYEIVPDCDIQVENLGCYHDRHVKNNRPLPHYYLTDRDNTRTDIYTGKTIDWRNWDVYMPELVCRCAKKAKEMGRTTFGVQYYGECWTGDQADFTYRKDGKSNQCIDKCYEPCEQHEKYCSGKQFANSVYRLGDATCELETTAMGCLKAASNLGTLLIDEKDPTSPVFRGYVLEIPKWDSQFKKMLCRCAREAHKKGYSSFAVHDTATCWGKHGGFGTKAEPSECVKGEEKCTSNSDQCAGGEKSVFVYKVKKPSKKSKRTFIPKFKEDGITIDDLLEV